MAYRIEYGRDALKNKRIPLWMLLVAFLLVLTVGILNPQVICYIRDLRLSDSLECIAEQLHSGEDLWDAVAAFGKDLLDGR